MQTKLAVAALLATVCAPNLAAAQGAYVRAEAGAGVVGTIEEDSLGEADLETGYQLGGAIGYAFAGGFRLEGEIAYVQNDLDMESLGLGGLGIDASISAVAGLANAYLDIGSGPLRPYFGAGVGYAQGEAEVSGGGLTLSTDEGGLAYQATAGLSYGFSKRGALDVGYRFFGANIEDTNVQIHGVTAGLRYNLGAQASAASQSAPHYPPAQQGAALVQDPRAPVGTYTTPDALQQRMSYAPAPGMCRLATQFLNGGRVCVYSCGDATFTSSIPEPQACAAEIADPRRR